MPVNCGQRLRKEIPQEALPTIKRYVSKCAVTPKFVKEGRLHQVDDLLSKLETCTDTQIKQVAINILKQINTTYKSDKVEALIKVEQLLDSINCATGRYSCLYDIMYPFGVSNQAEFRKELGKQVISAQKSGKNTDYETLFSVYINPLSETMRLSKLFPNKDSKILQKIAYEEQFAPLRNFISFYSEDKKLCNYLWEKYYLPRFDKQTQIILKDINSEFGVKLFAQEKPDKATLLGIKEELRYHKTLSNNEVNLPAVLNIDSDSEMYINARILRSKNEIFSISDGYAQSDLDKVTISPTSRIIPTLRHEITHLNEGISSSHIYFRIEKVKELMLAGLSKADIEYAMKKGEANAVFSQADMKKISDSTKRQFVKNGFPEYGLNMPSWQSIEEKSLLQSHFIGKSQSKLIDDLEIAMGGEIPQNIVTHLIENKGDFKYLKKILKNYKKDVPLSETELLEQISKHREEFEKYLKISVYDKK